MPTREEFLETGLVLFTPGFVDPDDPDDPTVCPICSDPDDLVQLPCNEAHIFCDECIRAWLKPIGNNTCPLCRVQLFEITDAEREIAELERLRALEEEPNLVFEPIRGRRERIDTAYQVSGLRRRTETQQFGNLTTFGLNIWLGQVGLLASNFTHRYLKAVRSRGPNQERRLHFPGGEVHTICGRGYINLETLLPRFCIMAHFVPGLAFAHGRPYTQQERNDWGAAVSQLGKYLIRKGNREVRDTGTAMAARMIRKFKYSWHTSEDVYESVFLNNRDEPVSERLNDFRILCLYVSYLAWEEGMRRDEAQRRKDEELSRRFQERKEVKARRMEAGQIRAEDFRTETKCVMM